MTDTSLRNAVQNLPAPARRIATSGKLAADWLLSLARGTANRATFDDVERYLLFVGPHRSGTTLIGQLLNAHPEAVVSHQLHAVKHYVDGWTRDQHMQLILDRDRRFVHDRDCRWNGYDYRVPGQWQGEFETLKVVGDKAAGSATKALGTDPELADRLERTVGVPVNYVTVMRNPFDVIGNFRKHGLYQDDGGCVEGFFRICDNCADLMDRAGRDSCFLLRHEEFISDPGTVLTELRRFLDLDQRKDWVKACSDIVFESKSKTRHDVDWSSETVEEIEERSSGYRFLDGYSFAD